LTLLRRRNTASGSMPASSAATSQSSRALTALALHSFRQYRDGIAEHLVVDPAQAVALTSAPGRLKRTSADESRAGPPEQRAGRSDHVPDNSAADEASGRHLKEEARAKRPRFARGSEPGSAAALGRSRIHGMTRGFQADDGEAASAVAEAAARSRDAHPRSKPVRQGRPRQQRPRAGIRRTGAFALEHPALGVRPSGRLRPCARRRALEFWSSLTCSTGGRQPRGVADRRCPACLRRRGPCVCVASRRAR
jgi:hypothetical protein